MEQTDSGLEQESERMTDLDIHIHITNADAYRPINDVAEDVFDELLELFEGDAEPPTEVEINIEVKE